MKKRFDTPIKILYNGAKMTKDELIEKLMKRTVVDPTDPNACWLWTGALSGGYGQAGILGKIWRLHRLSWTVHNGRRIPKGLKVCQTQKENIQDSVKKGRQIGKHIRKGASKWLNTVEGKSE